MTTWKEIRTKQNRWPQRTQTPTPFSNWNSCTASKTYLLWNIRKTISEEIVVEETVLCPAWYKFFIISFNLQDNSVSHNHIIFHFTDEETKALRGQVICPKSQPVNTGVDTQNTHTDVYLTSRRLSFKHPMLTPRAPLHLEERKTRRSTR